MPHTTLIVYQFFCLLLAAFVVAVITRHIRVPYTLALVITGLLIGIPHLIPQLHLDPGIVFTVFLPPLLFESALNLRLSALSTVWRPIVILTFAGTILSALVVGILSSRLLGMPLGIAMVFGALISATDPISVIAVFKRLGVLPQLSTIIEAESLFNDAVAVVLFTVAVSSLAGATASVASSVRLFVVLVAGGAVVGLVIGAIASKVHSEIDDHLVEITLTTIVAFGAYLGAQALHVSGVTAVVTAGIVMGNFGLRGMSASTRLAVSAFWDYAAFATNSVVFLLVGVEVTYMHWSGRLLWGLLAAVVVLAGRAVIYPLSAFVNRVRPDTLPLPWQHILVWGGLRGALSMALALGLDRTMPYREEVVSATFGAVVASLVVQGSTIGVLLRRLGLGDSSNGAPQEGYARIAAEMMATHAALYELDRFRAAETHPSWAVELLSREYELRLADLEKSARSAEPDYEQLALRQEAKARAAALSAEKNALQEAALRGWITADDRQKILHRIDEELVALRVDKVEQGG